jgi:short-subunit dehydrogenase
MALNPFADKVMWITGASSGLGAALAIEASSRGASLIISGRNEKSLATTASNCGNAHVKIIPFDLADKESRTKAIASVLSIYGRIDTLVLNAGVSQRSRFINTDPAVFERIIETNFLASVDIARACIPGMLSRNSGIILCISSIAGLMGAPWRTAYSASKHALGGFFSSLRAELVGHNILISMAYPGFVRTAISLNALSGDGSPHGILDPLQKFGQTPRLTAKQILDGISAGCVEIKVAFDVKAYVGLYLSRHFPKAFARTISRHGGL